MYCKNHKIYLNIDKINFNMILFGCSPITHFRWQVIFRGLVFWRLWKFPFQGPPLLATTTTTTKSLSFGKPQPLFSAWGFRWSIVVTDILLHLGRVFMAMSRPLSWPFCHCRRRQCSSHFWDLSSGKLGLVFRAFFFIFSLRRAFIYYQMGESNSTSNWVGWLACIYLMVPSLVQIYLSAFLRVVKG